MSKRWLVAMSALAQMACCIARGSKVKTPGGSRRIEELVVGDEVIVVDPQSLEEHVGKISAVRSAKRECSLINALKLTSAHPLFDTDKREWAPAGDWILGARTHFATTNGPIKVENTERFVGIDDVFDLSIDHPLHTFVADGVIVHNKPPLGGNTCKLADDTFVTQGDACSCAGVAGSIVCEGGLVGACSCDPARERWAGGGHNARERLEDFGRWEVVDCRSGDYGFSVESSPRPPPYGDSWYALEIDSARSRCGFLRAKVDQLGPPMAMLFEPGARVNAGVFGLGPDDSTKMMLMGVTDEDGGVRLQVSGSQGVTPVRFFSREVIPYSIWFGVTWELSWTGSGITALPRITNALSGSEAMNADTFLMDDGGVTLREWVASGQQFSFRTGTSQRLTISSGTGPTWVK